MRLYTRVGPEEVWPGYWNVVFSVLGNYGEFGDCGFEIACQLGDTHLAFRRKRNGTWSDWLSIHLESLQ